MKKAFLKRSKMYSGSSFGDESCLQNCGQMKNGSQIGGQMGRMRSDDLASLATSVLVAVELAAANSTGGGSLSAAAASVDSVFISAAASVAARPAAAVNRDFLYDLSNQNSTLEVMSNSFFSKPPQKGHPRAREDSGDKKNNISLPSNGSSFLTNTVKQNNNKFRKCEQKSVVSSSSPLYLNTLSSSSSSDDGQRSLTCNEDDATKMSPDLFLRRLFEWEEQLQKSLSVGISSRSTTLLPKAYVALINQLSIANPISLQCPRSQNLVQNPETNLQLPKSHEKSFLTSFQSTLPSLRQSLPANESKYLLDLSSSKLSSSLSFELMKNESLEEEDDDEQSNNSTSSLNSFNGSESSQQGFSGSCFRYRLTRPRLQCIEEEMANLNIDQSDSSSSANFDFSNGVPNYPISSRPFSESNFTGKPKFLPELKDSENELKKTQSSLNLSDLLPQKVENEQEKSLVETSSILAMISAIKLSLSSDDKEKITKKEHQLYLPQLKLVASNSLNSTDELQELARKLSMNSSSSNSPEDEDVGHNHQKSSKTQQLNPNSKKPAQPSKFISAFARALEEEKEELAAEVEQKQKDTSVNRNKRAATSVSFLTDSDDDEEANDVTSRLVPDILNSLGRTNRNSILQHSQEKITFPSSTMREPPIESFGSSSFTPNPEGQRHLTEAEMREKLAMQRAIMKDIEERTKSKDSKDNSLDSQIKKDSQDKVEDNHFLFRPSSSSFLRPTNRKPRIPQTLSVEKEHSSLTALLDTADVEEFNETPLSPVSENSFLAKARLQAALRPCKPLPPVSPFVGTLGGKNFEEPSTSGLSSLIHGHDYTTSPNSPSSLATASSAAPAKAGNALFGSFNPNSPMAPPPVKAAPLSAAEAEARTDRMSRFFSKLAEEGESRIDALASAAASTLSLISSAGVEVDGIVVPGGDEGDKKANIPLQPPPYSLLASFTSPTPPKVSGKAPMKRLYYGNDPSSLNPLSPSLNSSLPLPPPLQLPLPPPPTNLNSTTPPPLYYEDDEATMDMVLKLSAQEAAMAKVSISSKSSSTFLEPSKVPETSKNKNVDQDDEENWRSIPSTSGTQKVKPSADETIPGYPHHRNKKMNTSASFGSSSSFLSPPNSSSTLSAVAAAASAQPGSYFQRPTGSLVGQKRKREVTFGEMIGDDDDQTPPTTLTSSSKNENEDKTMTDVEEVIIPSKKHLAMKKLLSSQSNISGFPVPPIGLPNYQQTPLNPLQPKLSSSKPSDIPIDEDEIVVVDEEDEVVPIVPKNLFCNRKMAKPRTKLSQQLLKSKMNLQQQKVQNPGPESQDSGEELNGPEIKRKITSRKSEGVCKFSWTSSSTSSRTLSANTGGRSGYSTYNIGATQQWDLNDRYWERFSVTFVTSCAEEVPEAVAVDICEALKVWKQPKAFDLQAKRRYTVLLRRGPLKEGKMPGGGPSQKGEGPDKFRIVIGLDFHNSSSAEKRQAIENWKFLEAEQAFTELKKRRLEVPRLFDVLPNASTSSIDYFEFSDEDQVHSCFWCPEPVSELGDEHPDPDNKSIMTSFDLEFNCLTEHFANFMEIAEYPMKLVVKIERVVGSVPFLGKFPEDRNHFEYVKLAKLSCGVRIFSPEEKKTEDESSSVPADMD